MMIYESNELIGFFVKAFLLVLFSGIIILPFVPLKIQPIINVISVVLVALITSLLAIRGFKTGYGIVFIIAIFIGTVLNLWH
jgi:hypothetical protein